MSSSSPVDIEKMPHTVQQVTNDIYGNTHVRQTRVPHVFIPSLRAKREIISYLRDLQAVIKTDDHQFAYLPKPKSNNEFDQFLVEVHNNVVNKLNSIPTEERKIKYIDTYVDGMQNPLFGAKGMTNKRKKRTRGSKRRK
jgi:hypothetical protein